MAIYTAHAGHNSFKSGIAYGAVGLINESDEARKVNEELIKLFRTNNHIVYDCTVDNGKSQADVLNQIVAKCNSHKDAELNISIHFNAGVNDKNGNGITTGTEVLIYSSSSKAHVYAKRVVDEISKLGFKNRGVKIRPELAVLKNTTKPTILVECCFVDDKDDVNLYHPKSMAQAIAKGVLGTSDIQDDQESIQEPPLTALGDIKNLTNTQFIEYIGKLASFDMQHSGILASLTIAQAIKESGWGKSELAIKANALFGIKHNSDWNGKVYSKDTGECYDGKNYVTVNAMFRAYNNWEESVRDHSIYLCTRKIGNELRYRKVIGEVDYKKACFAIKEAGYATGLNYAEGLISLIEQHNLTRFDLKKTGTTPTPSYKLYKVQCGAFKNKNNAVQLSTRLKSKGYHTYIPLINGLYKVQVGAFRVKTSAENLSRELKSKGFDNFIAEE